MSTKTLLTVEAYAALGEDPPGVRYELSNGELIVTPSPNFFHNLMRDFVNRRLEVSLEGKRLGRVVSEQDFHLGGSIVRRPDVAFIRTQKLRGADLRQTPLELVPDLVIEIVSDFDRAADLRLKVAQYLEAGVTAVWLVYPQTQEAERHSPSDGAERRSVIEEPAFLPGFKLELQEILAAGEPEP